jgi:hypothetical protein
MVLPNLPRWYVAHRNGLPSPAGLECGSCFRQYALPMTFSSEKHKFPLRHFWQHFAIPELTLSQREMAALWWRALAEPGLRGAGAR